MNNPKLLRRLLLSVALIVLLVTVGAFIGYRQATRNPEILLDLVPQNTDMQLNKIRQTASKNGVKEWRLAAESATLIEQQKTMLLAKPDVEFFIEDGDNLHLTADQGTIYTDSSRMNVSGRVSANTSHYQFRTEALDYDPKARVLRSETPIELSGQAFTLQADSMAMDLKTNITRFEGGVQGIISEDLQL